jgi:hypothetical protein
VSVVRVLVIRSVSFQQLDLGLESIRAQFPGCAIDVLTHEHGKVPAESYACVSSAIVYPERGPFRRGGWAPPGDSAWDAVVVPVANVTGAGFDNVFDLATSLAPAVYRCNVAGEIAALSSADLRRLARNDRLNRLAGRLLGVPLGMLAAACLVLAVVIVGPGVRPRAHRAQRPHRSS